MYNSQTNIQERVGAWKEQRSLTLRIQLQVPRVCSAHRFIPMLEEYLVDGQILWADAQKLLNK